jgi:UDP-2,4-diacetamido-2,4,6-trideoxy-beta-L-altropyranose hydrolase
MKKAVFRVDSSYFIGSGHLMRCLTLAEELKNEEYAVKLICRELPGNLIEIAENKGFPVKRLPWPENKEYRPVDGEYITWLGVSKEQDAQETVEIIKAENPDLLIIDHYALDIEWEKKMRPFVKKIMVIDDLANRQHDCDIILDQNLVENMEARYDKLVPPHCQKLLGPDYLLLRSEFREARKKLRKRDGKIRRILIFMGGTDYYNITEKAIKAFLMLKRSDIIADVVVGKANPHKEKIKALCDEHPNLNYHCQVDNMAELMLKADLAIGGGGTATWERCYLGLPMLLMYVADNQSNVLSKMEAEGLVFVIRDEIHFNEYLRKILANGEEIKNVSERLLGIFDGNGVFRTVKTLCE